MPLPPPTPPFSPFAAVATVSRILLFRAGPQDMPYSPHLVRVLVPLSALVGWLLFGLLMPPLAAALMSVVNVLGIVLVAEGILRSRNLAARIPQTLAALLGAGIVFNLLMLYPASVLAPHLAELAKNPDLLKQHGTSGLPEGPILAIDGLNLWAFAVTAYIYHHAANVRVLGGIGLALVASLLVLLLVFMAASFVSVLLG